MNRRLARRTEDDEVDWEKNETACTVASYQDLDLPSARAHAFVMMKKYEHRERLGRPSSTP
ncbi:hypothetical protein CVT25_004510 [Psilocybe cyanescens]|uniref:Uncharacterized protein n=1 Tax=Psilocybe cyanescens TaxID=93625 RepID=A0A409XRJ8_PSICY|nr:hypothetical protein CVT25_004510 [Psilocybe cyanescens]